MTEPGLGFRNWSLSPVGSLLATVRLMSTKAEYDLFHYPAEQCERSS